MVYPVSNSSIPAANTFQPGGTEAAKPPEEKQADVDSTKQAGTESARSQPTEARNNGRTEDRSSSSDERSTDTGSVSASSARGTQLDVTA